MVTGKRCPFCDVSEASAMAADESAMVVKDSYPVSPGHSLVILRRHVGSLFDATEQERHSVLKLLDEAKKILDEQFRPDGYNIGINDGPASGQSIPHLHVHLIPRYAGDRPEPRGGVRWVLPEKARYWP